MNPRILRTAALITAVGTTALAAQPALASPTDHQTSLKETISTGAALASPDVSYEADFAAATGATLAPTGAITWVIDAGQLSPGAWNAMQQAPDGTRLGTFTSAVTGATPQQIHLHGVAKDTQGDYLRATIGVSKAMSLKVGSSSIPATLRMSKDGKQLLVSVNLQGPVGRFASLGAASALQSATLTLQGKITYGASLHAITLNPQKLTQLNSRVSSKACATAACTTLQPTIENGYASVHLPKAVTLQAPAMLRYGYRVSILGTGQPGDKVTLSTLGSDGQLLASPWSAYVKPDGSFEVRATVRSGFATDDSLVRPAAGRYVASATEGNATVLAVAPADTHVSLVTPIFHVQRKAGSKLHVDVRVPGADANVKVQIRLGSRTIASGTTSKSGAFSVTIPAPIAKGNLRAVASVAGADTAISSAIPFSMS
jgi:hypothetical protein